MRPGHARSDHRPAGAGRRRLRQRRPEHGQRHRHRGQLPQRPRPVRRRDESIGARLFASWLDENSEALAGAATIDRAGQTGIQQSDGIAYSLPEWKATGNLTYQNGGFSAFLQGRYIGDGTTQNTLVEGVNIESNHVDSAFYADLALSYRWELGEGAELEVFGQVTNLLDEDPPITAYYSAFLGYSQQYNP